MDIKQLNSHDRNTLCTVRVFCRLHIVHIHYIMFKTKDSMIQPSVFNVIVLVLHNLFLNQQLCTVVSGLCIQINLFCRKNENKRKINYFKIYYEHVFSVNNVKSELIFYPLFFILFFRCNGCSLFGVAVTRGSVHFAFRSHHLFMSNNRSCFKHKVNPTNLIAFDTRCISEGI